MILDMLASPLMQRSLLAALLVGICAPIVGTYLVHRRLAMLGDGIGHISLTGVALGWLAGTAANVTPHDQWEFPARWSYLYLAQSLSSSSASPGALPLMLHLPCSFTAGLPEAYS